jgi:hypothetical protein
MYHTSYAIFVDSDEFLVPMQNSTWKDMLSYVGAQMEGGDKDVGAYRFQNVFFNLNFTDDDKFINHSLVERYSIKTLLKTKHDIHKWSIQRHQRSKVMVIPTRVVSMNIHFVNEFVPIHYVTTATQSGTKRGVASETICERQHMTSVDGIDRYCPLLMEYHSGHMFHYRKSSMRSSDPEIIVERRMFNFADNILAGIEYVHTQCLDCL